MLSYQDQHLEQFYDTQGSYYQTSEVEQQASLQQQSNLRNDTKLMIQSTPDFSCYIESPSPQHQNQFNQSQYTYNNNNCNQNNLVLSISAPSSNESNHRTVAQVEPTTDQSGYDFNQVQHHHYIGHEHQQHIDQCRNSASSRMTPLEPMPNSAPRTETTNTLSARVSAPQQKQREAETHKHHNHQHNHLISSTSRQDPNPLVAANIEGDSSRAYGTRLQSEQQVDDMYNNNSCNNVTYHDQHLEQFYEPQDSYYQTMEVEHQNNLHYQSNMHTHSKLMNQSTPDYSCYIDSNKTTPQHQSQFNQTQYSYINSSCDHNQNNLVLATPASLRDESDHQTVVQVESNEQNGYEYNQIHHHHYIGHEHQQQIDQCRNLTSNRTTHLEPILNPTEQSAATNTLNPPPVTETHQKQRHETHKIQLNHLVASATNRQELNTLLTNHDANPSKGLISQQQQTQFKSRRGRPRKKGQRSKSKSKIENS